MNWLSRNNPFEGGRDNYNYGSSGYDDGDRHDYGFNSTRYGEPYAGGSHPLSMPPQRSLDSNYGYDAAYKTGYSDSSSRPLADLAPYDQHQRYELEPAHERFNNYADQPSYSSGYDDYGEEPYHVDRYKSYKEGYDDEPEFLFRTASKTYNFNALETTPVTEPSFTSDAEVTEASEEVLVRIRGAVVHLVDDQKSPLLGDGDFSIVLIEQAGNGLVTFVRVGDKLRWPLTKDEPAVKLDSSHYYFTIRFPRKVDEMDTETARSASPEVLSYGVTFPLDGQEEQLRELDDILETYSRFLSPKLVQGNKERDEFDGAFGYGHSQIPDALNTSRSEVLYNKQEKQDSSSDYWRIMAPNVDDYNSDLAKAFAMGTGSLIKGIFWLRDSTVAGLENGSSYMREHVRSTSNPSTINPQILVNLKRVKNMSMATETVANSILEGFVRAASFFSSALIRSDIGKKFFQLLPGEVALVSMDAFAKLFDALEAAGYDVAAQTKMFTQDVVAHRYGEQAGEVTGDTLSTAGHLFATAWTVTKVRSAWNPTKFKPTKTGMLKAAAKAVMRGAKD